MNASKATGTIGAVITFSTVATIIFLLLVWSYKAGRIIKGRTKPGESPLVDRKDDPDYYWIMFTICSLTDAFVWGGDIGIAIHGV